MTSKLEELKAAYVADAELKLLQGDK